MNPKMKEWKEAKRLTRRVRELMRDYEKLTGPSLASAGDKVEAVAVIIDREFDVRYAEDEIAAINEGRGIKEQNR